MYGSYLLTEVHMNRLARWIVGVMPILLAVAGVLMLPGIC